MSAKPLVVVTRPAEQAAALQQQLQTWDYPVLLMPLLTIEPVPWSDQTRTHLQQLHQYDFIHFSSPNAIRYALEPLSSKAVHWGKHQRIGLMGDGSRDMMRHYYPESEPCWICPEQDQPWDSEALIRVMQQQSWMKDIRRALLVKGQGGRELLATWLRAQAITVEHAVVYSRRCLQFTAEVEASLQSLAHNARQVWLLSSSEATLALGQVIQQSGDVELQSRCWQAPVLVTHERVALAAQQAGFTQVIKCRPGEQALKAALESLHV